MFKASIIQCSLEKQNQLHTHTHTHTHIYYKELAQVIMETEKSHDLFFVSWRPRKHVQRPENWKTNGVNSFLRCYVPAHHWGRKRMQIYLFVLFSPSSYWIMLTHNGEITLFFLALQFKWWPHPEKPSQDL